MQHEKHIQPLGFQQIFLNVAMHLCNAVLHVGRVSEAGDIFQAIEWCSSQHSLHQSTVIKNKRIATTFLSMSSLTIYSF